MWYAIQVLTGEEDNTISLCQAIIREQVLQDVFYPKAEVLRRYRGRWHKLIRPMFPGYIFVVTESVEKLFFALKEVPKLSKLLGAGMEPIALLEEEEELLLRVTNSEHIAEISLGVIEGESLIIQSGPLVGMEGMVRKIDRHKRTALVEVEMFGRKVEMKLALEVVKKQEQG